MILAVEIAFLIAGLYALFTAKMPSWIVGKGYKAEGNKVRVLGALMVALLPSVLCMGILLGLVSAVASFNVTAWAAILEIGIVIVVAIIVAIVLRNIRQLDLSPTFTDTSNIEPK
jgi:hypothetical protein